MTASVLSSTDAKLFKRLANPDVVDIELVPDKSTTKDNQRKATQQIKEAIEKAAATNDSSSSTVTTKSALREAMKKKEEESSSSEDEPEEKKPLTTRSAPPSEPPPPPPPKRPAAHDDEDSPPPAKRKKIETEDERLEKQGLLIELKRMEARGVQLSRRFTEDDTLEELEFEVVRQNASTSTDTAVSFAREMLRFGLIGIEMANKRMGPFLSLDGWSESVCRDMHRYDHALERLYKQYWRKHQVSPLLEIGGIIIGSMIMWHFQSSLFGAPKVAPQAAAAAPRPQAETASPQRQQQQQPRPKEARNDSNGRRPVLRPPTALFGKSS